MGMSEGVSHEHTTLFATSTSDSVETAFISENRSAEVRISTVRKESDLFFRYLTLKTGFGINPTTFCMFTL